MNLLKISGVAGWQGALPSKQLSGATLQIESSDVVGRAMRHDLASIQKNDRVAEPLDTCDVMTHEEHGPAFAGHVTHLTQTFFLKFGITDREHFVNHEYLRFKMRRNRKSQPHIHAAAVS